MTDLQIELTEGLGYDSDKNLFYMVFYAWYHDVPDKLTHSLFTGKSGITKYDVYRAMKESVPTRGKEFSQIPLFGFSNEKKYLPSGISSEKACLIAKKTDLSFKILMDEIKWTERKRTGKRDIGTEFYTGPKEIWADTIKQAWDESFNQAVKLCLGKRGKVGKGFKTKLSSNEHTEKNHSILKNYFEQNDKGILLAIMGYGKTSYSFYAPMEYPKWVSKDVIFYTAHNIFTTKQLAINHSLYAEGTVFDNSVKRIVICSDLRQSSKEKYFGIETYSASDPNLESIIESSLLFNKRCFFYINKKSYKEFCSRFEKVTKILGKTQKPGQITDEIQHNTGEKSKDGPSTVSNSYYDLFFGLTATLRKRGSDERTHYIYNDDQEIFGRIALEVKLSQGIKEKRNCPVICKTVEVSVNNEIAQFILGNEKIELLFSGKSELVRGNLLRACVSIVKAINEDNRSYILGVTPLIKNAEDACEILNILKEDGLIPNEYAIIKALAENQNSVVDKFESSPKAIMVGTPWIITGANIPKIDSVIPFHDFGVELTAAQFFGRGLRYIPNKILYCYVAFDPEQKVIPTMLSVINTYLLDESVSTSGPSPEKNNTIKGAKKNTPISFENSKENDLDPVLRKFWNEVYVNIGTKRFAEISDFTHYEEKYSLAEATQIIRMDPNIWSESDYYQCVKLGVKWREDFRKFFISPKSSYEYNNIGWVSWGDYTGNRFIEEARESLYTRILDTFESTLDKEKRIDKALLSVWENFNHFFKDSKIGLGKQLIGSIDFSAKRNYKQIKIEEVNLSIDLREDKMNFGEWFTYFFQKRRSQKLTDIAKQFPPSLQNSDLKDILFYGMKITGNIRKDAYESGFIQKYLPNLHFPNSGKFRKKALLTKYSEAAQNIQENFQVAYGSILPLIADYTYHYDHFVKAGSDPSKWQEYVSEHNSKAKNVILHNDLIFMMFTAIGKGLANLDNLGMDHKILIIKAHGLDPLKFYNYLSPKPYEVKKELEKAFTYSSFQIPEHKKSGILPFWIPEKFSQKYLNFLPKELGHGRGTRYYFEHVELKKQQILDKLWEFVNLLRNQESSGRIQKKGKEKHTFMKQNSILSFTEIGDFVGMDNSRAQLFYENKTMDLFFLDLTKLIKIGIFSRNDKKFIENFKKYARK